MREYPKWLHRGGESKIVADPDAAMLALEDGWTVTREVQPSVSPDPLSDEPDVTDTDSPVPLDVPARRKPGRPSKAQKAS